MLSHRKHLQVEGKTLFQHVVEPELQVKKPLTPNINLDIH